MLTQGNKETFYLCLKILLKRKQKNHDQSINSDNVNTWEYGHQTWEWGKKTMSHKIHKKEKTSMYLFENEFQRQNYKEPIDEFKWANCPGPSVDFNHQGSRYQINKSEMCLERRRFQALKGSNEILKSMTDSTESRSGEAAVTWSGSASVLIQAHCF